MKSISKEQVEFIRDNCDKANPPHINIASKRKKKGKTYYIEETRQVESLLLKYEVGLKKKTKNIKEGCDSNR